MDSFVLQIASTHKITTFHAHILSIFAFTKPLVTPALLINQNYPKVILSRGNANRLTLQATGALISSTEHIRPDTSPIFNTWSVATAIT